MHGVRKTKLPAEQEAAKQLERKKKLAAYTAGRDLVLEKHKSGLYDSEGLGASAKLLAGNPDIYTFWNYRRKAAFSLSHSDDAFFKNELSLTETCLEKQPKSYSAWHHRSWVLQQMQKPDYENEIKLCNRALKMDERNFHCWDHRRTVCQLAKISKEDELQFTEQKILENFSNYSAWHYRSTLLKDLRASKSDDSLAIEEAALIKELELAKNAFYTDPEDQSAWFYSRWLFSDPTLGQTSATPLSEALTCALESHLIDCEELVAEEPTNKWPLLIATLCMQRLNKDGMYLEKMKENLHKLKELDKLRKGYYEDLLKKF